MEWSNKNVLITGICGFIGSNLAKKLLSSKAQITGIDNFEYVDKHWIEGIANKITFIEGDISESETVEEMKDAKFDYIFHFAAPSSVVLFNKNPKRCYRETVEGMRNILDLAKRIEIKKLVYPSTGSLYGGNAKPHSEVIYPKPKNLYAAAKFACEGLASSYVGVKSIGLRIFAGYGPGEERKGEFASIICLFINDMLEGKSPIVYGDGSQERDFVYIDDVTNAIIRSAEIDFTGVINVGTGSPTSFSKVIQLIQKETGNKIEPTYIKKEIGYVESLAADTVLMKKMLNIEPITIESGVKEFVQYLKKDKN